MVETITKIAAYLVLGFALAICLGIWVRSGVKKQSKEEISPEAVEKGKRELEGASSGPNSDS